MASLLIIEAQVPARENIASALDGLGYSIRWLDGLKAWKAEAQDEVPAADMILLSLDSLDGLGPEGIGSAYAQGARPVPLVVWSRDLPRARMISGVPPEVVLGAVFEGVPSSAEVLLLVSGRLAPTERGLAVQRLLKLLSSARAPARTTTPRGTHEISDFALPRALVSLAVEGWSGSVTVEPLRGRTLRFWFENGGIVLASDGQTGELLREARRRGLDRKGADPPKSFEVLRDELLFLRRSAGLSKSERSSVVEWYSAELVARACTATEGRLHVVDYAEPEFSLGLGLSLDVRSLLLAAARSAPQDVLEGRSMQDAWFVLPSLPVEEEGDSWALEGANLALRDYLGAHRATRLTVGSVRSGLVALGENSDTIAALLARLSEMGYLRFVGPPFDEVTTGQLTELSAACFQAHRQDYFTLLGIPRTASKKVLDAAVLEASRRWHPDTFAGSHPRVQSLAVKLFSMLREAADALADVEGRQAYIEDLQDGVVGRGGQDPERARVLLAKGRISLKSKRFAAAAAEFASATIADPSLFEARLLTHWAEYLADPDEAATSVAALQALAKVRDANAELWGFLGRMYLNSGDEERALKCFEKAIKMDPDHVDSLRQLRLIVKRSSAAGDGSKKSFWNRLRGK